MNVKAHRKVTITSACNVTTKGLIPLELQIVSQMSFSSANFKEKRWQIYDINGLQ